MMMMMKGSHVKKPVSKVSRTPRQINKNFSFLSSPKIKHASREINLYVPKSETFNDTMMSFFCAAHDNQKEIFN
jgi:hypothetical protein